MPTLESIGQIAIPTHDLPRAVAFYRDALGLEHLFEAGPLAFFRCGDVRIMLAVPENGRSTTSSIVYFRVDDIHGARAELADRRAVRRRRTSSPGCPTTALDDLLPRPGSQRPRADERTQVCHPLGQHDRQLGAPVERDGDAESVSSACRASEYAASVSAWERTLSATTSAPGSSSGRASAKSVS